MKSLLAGLVIGMALSPSAPQAADVERVQRACATLKREYVEFDPMPPSSKVADEVRAHGWPEQRYKESRLTIPIVDARVYELFCK